MTGVSGCARSEWQLPAEAPGTSVHPSHARTPAPPGTHPWLLAQSSRARGAACRLLASGVTEEVQGTERTRCGFGGAPARRHAHSAVRGPD